MADKADLKVRRELLDPNFDGYKLSLDPLPTYTCKFENGITFLFFICCCHTCSMLFEAYKTLGFVTLSRFYFDRYIITPKGRTLHALLTPFVHTVNKLLYCNHL